MVVGTRIREPDRDINSPVASMIDGIFVDQSKKVLAKVMNFQDVLAAVKKVAPPNLKLGQSVVILRGESDERPIHAVIRGFDKDYGGFVLVDFHPEDEYLVPDRYKQLFPEDFKRAQKVAVSEVRIPHPAWFGLE